MMKVEGSYIFCEGKWHSHGYFTVCKINDGTVDIGLGMRPNMTGNGFGLQFLNAILAFSKEKYGCKYITLSVAIFNERAIKSV